MPVIELSDVSKTFPPRVKGEAPLVALDNVSLHIEQGDIYGIIGYSGAGKSTLVRLINALERTTSGSIVVGGEELSTLKERELRRIRLGIGMVFQQDRKSTRLNSSHVRISYAVFCLKKKKRE